jgi:hypothetical protein
LRNVYKSQTRQEQQTLFPVSSLLSDRSMYRDRIIN